MTPTKDEVTEMCIWLCAKALAMERWGSLHEAMRTKEAADMLADMQAKVARLSTPKVADAARDVLAERARQISAEGWTAEHDDMHRFGDMARAAASYAMAGADWPTTAKTLWPWSGAWWKPTDRRRDLVKAGALILAEIERLDRITQPKEAGHD